METKEYERLVSVYLDNIYRVAVNGCKNYADAEDVTFDSEEKCAFVTVKQDLSEAMIEIQIPYTWRCKLVTGGKFVLTDLKVGDQLSLNLKENAVQKDGIYYAIPKGTVKVAP